MKMSTCNQLIIEEIQSMKLLRMLKGGVHINKSPNDLLSQGRSNNVQWQGGVRIKQLARSHRFIKERECKFGIFDKDVTI